MVNRRLVHRYPLEALLRNAVFIATIAAIVLAVATGLKVGGITVIVGAVFVFFSMNGIIAATSTACALDAVPNVAGSASALMGALQYGSGIISSLLLALFSDGTPWTMGWIIALFTAASALMALTVQLKNKTSLLMPDDTFIYRYPPFPVTQGGVRFIWHPKRNTV